jgi:hypothetical protein
MRRLPSAVASPSPHAMLPPRDMPPPYDVSASLVKDAALDAEIVQIKHEIHELEQHIRRLKEPHSYDVASGRRKSSRSPIRRVWTLVRHAQAAHRLAELATLRNALDRAYSARRDLCVRRNHVRAPLCRLSAEILIQILEELVEDYTAPISSEGSFKWPEMLAKPLWPRVRLVCACLNTAVLACPVLWTNVHLGLKSLWTPLHTAYVGNRGLSMTYVDTGVSRLKLDDRVYPAIAPRRARHARVYLEQPFGEAHDVLGRALPYLYSLVYSVRGVPAQITSAWGSHPSSVFQALTQLVLRGITLHATGLQFPSLVHFELDRVVAQDGTAPLFALLRASPHLEFLWLHTRFNSQVFECPSIVECLPSLKTLHLGCHPLDAAVLVDALPAPADTYHIAALDFNARMDVDDWARILSLFSSVPGVDISDSTCIRVDCPRMHTPRVCLTVVDRDVKQGMHAALKHTQKLRVGMEIMFLFDPLCNSLDQLTYLALPKVCVTTYGRELRDWFAKRAGLGRGIHTVDFYGYQDLRPSPYPLDRLEWNLLATGAVEVILHDGREVGRRRPSWQLTRVPCPVPRILAVIDVCGV